jgi:cellulose synthase/poly-beta-1,6-N-acetylglucosamine synthase-like glycosyltransferase
MRISIVIAFYKNTRALELILMALDRQTYNNFEVIIAEDDNNTITRDFIEAARANSKLMIRHVFQDEDSGFRKNKILNKAISVSEGDFIIFTDGDCIPGRNFLQAYINAADEFSVLFGRRVMLSEELTEKLYKERDLSLLSFWSLITHKAKRIKYSLYLPFYRQKRETGLFGCNWGLFKKQLVAVNGYDEDYVTAGVGEDADIEWRLQGLGLQLVSIRYSACQYHLHHPLNYSDVDVNIGFDLLKEKKEKNLIICKNGLVKMS